MAGEEYKSPPLLPACVLFSHFELSTAARARSDGLFPLWSGDS